MNGEGGALGVHAIFGQKLLDTQRRVSRCAHKSAIMKWANTLSLQKNSLKLKAASHNNASWYTDTDGFLEHSLSRRSLYHKALPLEDNSILGGSPLLAEHLFASPLDQALSWLYLQDIDGDIHCHTAHCMIEMVTSIVALPTA